MRPGSSESPVIQPAGYPPSPATTVGGEGRGRLLARAVNNFPLASDFLHTKRDLSTQTGILCGMEKVIVNLRLDKALVERIDAAAGPRKRTRWMVAAFEAGLGEQGTVSPTPRAVKAVRSQVFPARALVSADLEDQWGEIMAARQARLNKARDSAPAGRKGAA
jgi:hypothetical protein